MSLLELILKIKPLKVFFPAILWAIVILYLSAGPGFNLPDAWTDIFSVDKLGHTIVYGILSGLILFGYLKRQGIPSLTTKTFALAVFLSSFYGILMEIMQYSFFPGRYFEFLDIIANIIGSILGIAIFKFIYLKKE